MPTVAASFDEALPITFGRDDHPRAHISGSTTAVATPPLIAYAIDYQVWNGFAIQALHRAQLGTKRVAAAERGIRIVSEGDVAYVGSLYLANPVQLAFESAHQPQDQILHMNEWASGANARCDMAWVRYNEENIAQTIAVLDFKAGGTIRPDEFRHAVVQPERSVTALNTARGEDRSRFQANSEILLKQAVNYAFRYSTRFIAFYDVANLVLLVMESQDELDGGDFCYVTRISQRNLMRPALLGFLERAYQAIVT